MKKKVLSVLLAAALFAGSAVAVNAQVWGNWDSSSQSGTDADITKLEFDAASYNIENGSDLALIEKLTAYAGDKKIVQEPTLDWAISDNELVFGLETDDNAAKVFAYENSGSATVTVTANDGKVKASCKVVATAMTKATGYAFGSTSYKLPTGNGTGAKDDYVVAQDVKLVPSPSKAKFSQQQRDAFNGVDVAFVTTKDVKSNNGGPAYTAKNVIAVATLKESAGDDEAKFTFTKADLEAIAANVTNGELVVVKKGTATVGQVIADADKKISFPNYDSNKDPKDVSRSVKTSTLLAKQADRAGRTGTITVEVGQTVDINKYVKFGPSDANTGKDDIKSWSVEYYNDAATESDYAVLNGDKDKIMGVAVGSCKLVATFNPLSGANMTVEIPVKVVAKGANTSSSEKPALAMTSGTLAVGETAWVEVKNAPSNADQITWTVEDNGVATIVPQTGAGIKVFAKKEGTAKITATYNGEEIGTYTVTVKAKGATVTPPTTTPSVPNPGTGDSLFANLF